MSGTIVTTREGFQLLHIETTSEDGTSAYYAVECPDGTQHSLEHLEAIEEEEWPENLTIDTLERFGNDAICHDMQEAESAQNG